MRSEGLSDRLLRRFGHHYVLVLMLASRLLSSIGGAAVVYYVNLTLNLPQRVRDHFHVVAALAVAASVTLTVLLALWETRHLRRVLRRLRQGQAVAPALATLAGREAVLFPGRHHRNEAWL